MRVYKNGNKMSVVYKEELYSRLSFKGIKEWKTKKLWLTRYHNGIYYNLVGNLF